MDEYQIAALFLFIAVLAMVLPGIIVIIRKNKIEENKK